MERSTTGRKPRTSTEGPASAAGTGSRSNLKSHGPSDGVGKVLFRGQMPEEEAQSLLNRKSCSGSKLKEMTGNQASSATSQISFSNVESVSPKKPTFVAEIAKPRELNGSLHNQSVAKQKQLSEAKSKELSGHDIFGPPREIPVRTRSAAGMDYLAEHTPRNTRSPVKLSNPSRVPSNLMFSQTVVLKTARKVHERKSKDLSGNGIFKGEPTSGAAEKKPSAAKFREKVGAAYLPVRRTPSASHLAERAPLPCSKPHLTCFIHY